ncbi:hypothetical protein [Paenibacillus xylanilyticus]|uniref:hypothetical protein n=1 Tax=Paenibacillus TaxID=44249 RepID=UPI003AAEA0F9
MTRKVVIEINFNNYGFDPKRLTGNGWSGEWTFSQIYAELSQDFLILMETRLNWY